MNKIHRLEQLAVQRLRCIKEYKKNKQLSSKYKKEQDAHLALCFTKLALASINNWKTAKELSNRIKKEITLDKC
jgi:hypothetical protein